MSEQLEYELEDDPAMYEPRRPSSAVPINKPVNRQVPQTIKAPPFIQRASRPQSLAPGGQGYVQPGTYTNGRTKLNVKIAEPPGTTAAPGRGRNIRTDDVVIPRTRKRTRLFGWFRRRNTQPREHRIHWLLYVGIGMVGMLLLWQGLTALVTWATWELNNISYGMPRTFQLDGIIKQNNDSPSNPTHIIFVNLNRKIQVIIEPAGDISKAQIYLVTTLIEEGSELWPVTGEIKDLNGDGKPDILITVNGNAHTALINTGDKFRAVLQTDNIHL